MFNRPKDRKKSAAVIYNISGYIESLPSIKKPSHPNNEYLTYVSLLGGFIFQGTLMIDLRP